MLVDFLDLVHQWKPPVGARRSQPAGRTGCRRQRLSFRGPRCRPRIGRFQLLLAKGLVYHFVQGELPRLTAAKRDMCPGNVDVYTRGVGVAMRNQAKPVMVERDIDTPTAILDLKTSVSYTHL